MQAACQYEGDDEKRDVASAEGENACNANKCYRDPVLGGVIISTQYAGCDPQNQWPERESREPSH